MLIAQELDWWELGSFCLQVTWNKSCTAVWALTAAAYCLQANLVSQMIHDSACLVKLLRFFLFFFSNSNSSIETDLPIPAADQLFGHRLLWIQTHSRIVHHCHSVKQTSNHMFIATPVRTRGEVLVCVKHLVLTWLWWCYSWHFLGEPRALLVAPWHRVLSEGTNISLGHKRRPFPSLYREVKRSRINWESLHSQTVLTKRKKVFLF